MKDFIKNNQLTVSNAQWLEVIINQVRAEKEKKESGNRVMDNQLLKATGGKNVVISNNK